MVPTPAAPARERARTRLSCAYFPPFGQLDTRSVKLRERYRREISWIAPGCPMPPATVLRAPVRRAGFERSAGRAAGYGVATGQAVAPLLVQVMRPWMAGLIGECAVR